MSPTYSICQAHGYLDGEQEVCPICGDRTEVYSRITGYYRPVQNWNDGKTQEFANRKLYDIEHSVLKKHSDANAMYQAGMKVVVPEEISRPNASDVAAAQTEGTGEVRYLFTTKTCPEL